MRFTESFILSGTFGNHIAQIYCSKQAQHEQVVWDHVHSRFKYFQGQTLVNLSGQCLTNLAVTKIFFGLHGISSLSASLHCLLSFCWAPLVEFGFIFFTDSHQVFRCIHKTLQNISSLTEQSKLSQPFFI